MDKIDIKSWEEESIDMQVVRCMGGINQLIEGYEKLLERIEKRENDEQPHSK